MSKCFLFTVALATMGTPTIIIAGFTAYINPNGASQPNFRTANLGNVASKCLNTCFKLTVNKPIAKNCQNVLEDGRSETVFINRESEFDTDDASAFVFP